MSGGDRTRSATLARSSATVNTSLTSSLLAGLNRRPRSYHDRALPTELRRHRRNLQGRVSSGGFEPTLPTSSTSCLLPVGLRGHASLRPGSNRLPASYEDAALPGELRRHSLGKQESNLHKRDRLLIQSQACCRVTPFPSGTGGGSRTRMSSRSPRFELGAPAVYATPACAARDSNPDNPG